MERIAMNQEERDWLEWLKRVKDGAVTQQQAAAKMDVSVLKPATNICPGVSLNILYLDCKLSLQRSPEQTQPFSGQCLLV